MLLFKEDELGASVSESDHRLRYGGPWFSAASALPIEGDMARCGPLYRFFAAALRRPSRLAALFALLLRTRLVSLELSNSLHGQALRDYFNDRSFGLCPRHQFFQGVLVLPRDHAVYLRGRRRQALRTNLRHAAAAGISCEEITDRSGGLDHILDIEGQHDEALTEKANAWREVVAQPELTLVVARDAQGCPLAVAGVVVDDMVCLIRFAIATNHGARWALHDHLVRLLIARGVSYLVAEGGGPFGALEFEPNLQHYQHLLGYELRHLTLSTPSAFARKRRVLGFAAVALTSVALTSVTLLVDDAAASGREIVTTVTAARSTERHARGEVALDAARPLGGPYRAEVHQIFKR